MSQRSRETAVRVLPPQPRAAPLAPRPALRRAAPREGRPGLLPRLPSKNSAPLPPGTQARRLSGTKLTCRDPPRALCMSALSYCSRASPAAAAGGPRGCVRPAAFSAHPAPRQPRGPPTAAIAGAALAQPVTRYTIKRGDSIYAIARRHGTSPRCVRASQHQQSRVFVGPETRAQRWAWALRKGPAQEAGSGAMPRERGAHKATASSACRADSRVCERRVGSPAC